MASSKRFFIIRAQQAKRECAANENAAPTTITINGRTVTITDANRRFAETILARDAERAFEAAVYHRPYQSQIAHAA